MSTSSLVKKSLVKFLEWRKVKAVRHKTAVICKNLDQTLVDELASNWDTCYLGILKSEINKKLIAAYAVLSGRRDGLFMPEDIYYNKIEPALNNRLYALAYADKNFYEKIMPEYRDIFPTTLLRRINGFYHNRDYDLLTDTEALDTLVSANGVYIAKPSVETSGGNNILRLNISKGRASLSSNEIPHTVLLAKLEKMLGKNYIIQDSIRQSPWFEQINSSSLNTVRLMTYRSVKTGIVYHLSAVVRFGQTNSLVDNQAAGGMSCGINRKGILNAHTVDKYGTQRRDWPWLVQKAGTAVPAFQEMCRLAVKIAPSFPYHRLLGFDFCVDMDGQVRLIEINLKNLEINFLQMNNGPLFGEHTTEVVEYCSTNPRSFLVGFYA